MKTARLLRLSFGCLLAGFITPLTAQAEPFLNAHYEINVHDDDSENSVRSTFRVLPGGSERLELYPNVVEFTVQPVSETEYELLVTVAPKKTMSPARLTGKFKGTYGKPLELSSQAEGIELSGAISVVMMERNAL